MCVIIVIIVIMSLCHYYRSQNYQPAWMVTTFYSNFIACCHCLDLYIKSIPPHLWMLLSVLHQPNPNNHFSEHLNAKEKYRFWLYIVKFENCSKWLKPSWNVKENFWGMLICLCHSSPVCTLPIKASWKQILKYSEHTQMKELQLKVDRLSLRLQPSSQCESNDLANLRQGYPFEVLSIQNAIIFLF